MKTNAIEIKEKADEKTTREESRGILQKLKDLF